LLLIRTVVLLFLIILAPLAFLAYILPNTSHYFSSWHGKLFKQAFFAPAYMFMIYLVAGIMSNTGGVANAVGVTDGDKLFSFLDGGEPKALVYFIILIGFMAGALMVAQEMGAKGATTVAGWGRGLKGWGQARAKERGKLVAGKIPGYISRRGAESEAIKRFAATSPRIGGGLLRTFQSGSKLGINQKKVEARTETARKLSPEQQAAYFRNLGRPLIKSVPVVGGALGFIARGDTHSREAMLGKLTPNQRMEMMKNAAPEDKKAMESILLKREMFEKMSSTERSNMYQTGSPETKTAMEKLILNRDTMDKMSQGERMRYHDDPTASVVFKEEMEKLITSNKELFEKLSAREQVDLGEKVAAANKAGFDLAVKSLPIEALEKYDKEKKEVVKATQAKDAMENIGKYISSGTATPVNIKIELDKMGIADIKKLKPEILMNENVVLNLDSSDLSELAKTPDFNKDVRKEIVRIIKTKPATDKTRIYVETGRGADFWDAA
ncbi:MAG TPA: hypothetical protein VJJ73_00675, partial [Candidatus Paceibacterota bacterium]